MSLISPSSRRPGETGFLGGERTVRNCVAASVVMLFCYEFTGQWLLPSVPHLCWQVIVAYLSILFSLAFLTIGGMVAVARGWSAEFPTWVWYVILAMLAWGIATLCINLDLNLRQVVYACTDQNHGWHNSYTAGSAIWTQYPMLEGHEEIGLFPNGRGTGVRRNWIVGGVVKGCVLSPLERKYALWERVYSAERTGHEKG